MRESTMWATSGGPIIGEIRNGKKYPFGTVSATQYEEDMAALNADISGLNAAVVACQGSLTGLTTALDTLNGQYAATVPGLSQAVSDIRVQITDVTAALTAAVTRLETAIGNLGQTVNGIDTELSERISQTERGLQSANAGISANTQDIAVNTANISSLTGRVDTLSGKVTHDVDSLTGRITAAESGIQGLDTRVSNIALEQASQGAAIGALGSDLGEVSDLATGTAATTAANSEAITGIRDAITAIRASVTANTEAINAFNSAITELTSTQNVDRATLTARIEAVENAVTALSQTVEDYSTALNNRISGVRADVDANMRDIAVIQSALQTQGAAISAQDGRIQAVESRMNSEEVAMATLRQQLLNSVNNINDELDMINTDKAAIKADLAALAESISAYEADTAITLREYNNRISALEDSIPLEIINFRATPDICETGGSENVILSWNIQGTIAQITLDGQNVTGQTEVTKPNVRETTTYLLNVVDRRGNTARATVTVNFVNHVFWGTSASAEASEATLKGLDYTELSDDRVRTFNVDPDYEYIYYAYPKRLGTSEFKVNDFVGGFEDPVIVSVDNHAGYSEDYYVYRSANKLNSRFEVHVI